MLWKHFELRRQL